MESMKAGQMTVFHKKKIYQFSTKLYKNYLLKLNKTNCLLFIAGKLLFVWFCSHLIPYLDHFSLTNSSIFFINKQCWCWKNRDSNCTFECLYVSEVSLGE